MLCVTLCDTRWHCCSRLQNSTDILYSPTFLSLSVFVFPHVFVIVFVFSIFTMTSMTFPQSFLWHPPIPPRSTASDVKMHRGMGGLGEEVGGRGGGVQLPYVSISQIYSITFQQSDVDEPFRGYLHWLCSYLKKLRNLIIIFIHSSLWYFLPGSIK